MKKTDERYAAGPGELLLDGRPIADVDTTAQQVGNERLEKAVNEIRKG